MDSSIDLIKRRLLTGKVRVEQSIRLPWVIDEAIFTNGCTQMSKLH